MLQQRGPRQKTRLMTDIITFVVGNSTILNQDGKTKILSHVACFYWKCLAKIVFWRAASWLKSTKAKLCQRTVIWIETPFATLETRKGLEPKCFPQLILGLLLGTRRSAIGQFFPSLVSVPEVLAKVSAQFPCFFSSEKGFVNRFRSTQSDKNSTYILV